VNHQQTLVSDLGHHHLQIIPIRIITKVDKPDTSADGRVDRWRLPKAKATVLDDIARLPTSYPMLGCGASPLQCGLANSSDNNITVSGHRLTFTRYVCLNKTAR